MATFNLPDLGEGLHEAEIVAWHVSAGDHVTSGQPLVSVETDKAVVEIPSPQSGRIENIVGGPGDVIEVGDPLVAFAEAEAADSGTVVGAIPDADRPSRIKAPPAVRALAARLGVELSSVSPSGPDGTVTRPDVEAAAEGGGHPTEPLRGMRRAMARRMAEAHAEVVPATVTAEADVENWPADADVMVRLIRAIVSAAGTEPALNAWYDSHAGERHIHDHIDLGIAMDTADGLIVPVLRDAGGRDAADLRRTLDVVEAAAEARAVPQAELRGQTFTLSNFGALGGRFAALVLTPPQVGILGAGRIAQRVVAHEGAPAVRRVLPLSLTFDHRVVTGGEATRFLMAAVADLEMEA